MSTLLRLVLLLRRRDLARTAWGRSGARKACRHLNAWWQGWQRDGSHLAYRCGHPPQSGEERACCLYRWSVFITTHDDLECAADYRSPGPHEAERENGSLGWCVQRVQQVVPMLPNVGPSTAAAAVSRERQTSRDGCELSFRWTTRELRLDHYRHSRTSRQPRRGAVCVTSFQLQEDSGAGSSS